MPNYTLASPIPSIATCTGNPSEGVSSSSSRFMWRDSIDVVHILACFGGDASGGWYGVYINTDTGDSYLVNGAVKGETRHGTYLEANGKFYQGTGYATWEGSLTEFDPATGTLTKIKDQIISTPFAMLTGDDNRIYMGLIDGHVYSYDPTTTTWLDYGALPAFDPGPNSITLGVDSTHVYVGYPKSGGGRLFVSAIIGTPGWSATWEFADSGDTSISIYLNENHVTQVWVMRRTLSDTSYKFYVLSVGGYTELTPGEVGYTWSGTPQILQGEYHQERGPNYRVAASDENTYPYMLNTYGWDVDFELLQPLKEVQEFSRVGYRFGASGDFTYVEEAFTGPWVTVMITTTLPKPGSNVFAVSDSYNATLNYAYEDVVSSYLGANLQSPYCSMQHSSGEIYVGGYSNSIMRYDPSLLWTLSTATRTPCLPGDAESNPYFILTPATKGAGESAILHYRYVMDYDADGIVWIGGNTTRTPTPPGENHGDVMWYDPSDGSTGWMFESWYDATAGVSGQVRDLCAAVGRTIICVSDRLGNIWLINAAAKTVGVTPVIPVESGGASWMIETSNDVVFGVVMDNTTSGFKVFRFQPSAGTILTAAQDLGVAGAPFGFGTGEYNRMRRKLVLGPDGYVWMYVGNTLYRVHPTTLEFVSVDATGTYGKITFVNGNRDLLWYGYNTTVKYYPDIFSRIDNRLVAGSVAAKVGGSFAEKINGTQFS